MCGICGFTNGRKQDLNMLKRMCKTMAHRGPDGEGYYINDGVAFGHRRLSLVDLEHGNQPIIRTNSNKSSQSWHGTDATYWKRGQWSIVLNGEIYNYKELAQELKKIGYTFNTKSDTEVVLIGFIEWGVKLLNKLRGMFAFAIWNSKSKKLFCVRDFFGIKPLYYTLQNNTFIFASEIKVLLEHRLCPKKVNLKALEQYLCFQFSALQETFFKDIYTLEPGHYLYVDLKGNIEIKQYWRPKFYVDDNGNTTKECKCAKSIDTHEKLVKKINDVMHESVKYHNIADVEVGSLLSSGIDSSYNAAILHKINPKMRTFTVGFEAYSGKQDEYKGERNEIEWAKELASMLDVENNSKTISEKEYWDALPQIAWHMDEPNGDPSAIALYFVDQIAASKVKAVLSGEGADELFGGYTIYQTTLASTKLNWIPKPLLKKIAHVLKKRNIRGYNYAKRAATGVESWYYTNSYGHAFAPEEVKNILKNCTNNLPTNPINVTKKCYHEANIDNIDDCAKMQYTDLHFWILGDILLKGDKMSMAHSLECRVPFLDKEVFEVARAIPTKDKISSKQTKIALREAAKSTIPAQWANKKKLGFPVPMVLWLREDKYYNIIKSEFKSKTSSKFFNTEYLISLLDEHKNSQKDNSRKIWIIYMFLLWHKVFFEN